MLDNRDAHLLLAGLYQHIKVGIEGIAKRHRPDLAAALCHEGRLACISLECTTSCLYDEEAKAAKRVAGAVDKIRVRDELR